MNFLFRAVSCDFVVMLYFYSTTNTLQELWG
jgi:hypothetical protein